MLTSFTYLNPPVRHIFLGRGAFTVPRNTVSHMRSIIINSAINPYIRKWAEKMIESVPDRDEEGEVRAVYNFLQRHTRYAKDPRGAEYIQTPDYVLHQLEIGDIPSLDCDDFCVLGLSLLRSLGYETAIRTAGYRPDKHFSHVYGLVKVKNCWLVFDAVRKGKPLNWEAPNATIKEDVKV